MKKYISRFHYLTQDMPDRSHIAQAEIACSNGANWIQYYCMSKTDEDMLTELHPIAAICDDWGATLIIANHDHLLHQADIQGVHIHDMNADLQAIRTKIGDDKTLGTSANSIKQLLAIQAGGFADYCFCGPFGYTVEVSDDDQPLGFGAYRQLQAIDIEIPVIATGGIQLHDVEPLLNTGIHGIAVSTAINKAPDPAQAVKAFYRAVF